MNQNKALFPEFSNYLKESITSFSAIANIPVTLYNKEGNKVWEINQDDRLCNLSYEYQAENSSCSRNLISSMNYASRLGEPYIFFCQGGLVNIAVSLMADGNQIGCFIAGPLIMGELRESTISKIFKTSRISSNQYPKLILSLNQMNIYTPQEVSNLALLLNNSVLSSVQNTLDYVANSKQSKNQAALGSDLQNYKKTHKQMNYPYELESQLIESVKKAESDDARNIITELIQEIYLLESGNLNAIKAKIFGLNAIIKREISELGLMSSESQDFDLEDINDLYEEQTLEGLIQQASIIIERLASIFEEKQYSGSSEIISKTLKYINKMYREKLSLKQLAEELYVNPSYLSMLFKQEMNISFTDYITTIRIKEAKRLLTETNLNMLDIAIRCGFEDQSYFTKVYKKIEGVTPKQYRSEHSHR